MRTVQTKEIEEWLHALGLAPQSFNNYRARVSSLFGYGVKRGYLERNPVSAIDKMKSVDQAPGIFTADELRLLLEKAPADLLPMFAIGAFAGLRTAQLVRLEWSEVDLRRGHIYRPPKGKRLAAG